MQHEATMQRIGNSQGFTIPKDICELFGFSVGSKVTMTERNGELCIAPQKSYTIDALLDGYTGPKPEAYDWGAPVGREVW